MEKIKTLRILWGVKVGDENWQEQIITTDGAKIEQAKAWGIANGFGRFRISTDNGQAPDFTKTIRNKR